MIPSVEQIEVETPDDGRTYVNFGQIALRRMPLVALGLVVGVVLGSLYYAMWPPTYRSDAQVLLIKKQPDAFPITGTDRVGLPYREDYLSTHQVIIKSPLIVGRAIEKRELYKLDSLRSLADPIKAIIR